MISEVDEVLTQVRDPGELARTWEEDGKAIIAANAQSPVCVQRRMSRVAGGGQAQLMLD